MIKTLALFVSAFCVLAVPALAETKKAAPAQMQPDLRKILEDQAKKEDAAWDKSNLAYAKTCLAGIEAGKPVPPEKAVTTTECYIKEIDKNVKPVALNTHMVDDMTKEWKALARKYGAKQISHKEWLGGMQETQKKFAAARIQVIKGLIADAQKQAAAKTDKAAKPAKTAEKK